ncbi:MAG: undecaprenyl/decaprenyl-phosphate alpha-N-acetylglucosaminyl 1-phosphate transferase [Trebonia sp.]
MREYLFILIIAAVVTYLLTPLVRQGAIAINAQHAPRERDVHTRPTPLLGGVAMYGGLVAGLLVADRLSYLAQAFPPSPHGHPSTIDGILLAGGLLVVVGIVDDRWGLGAVSKLAAQIAAGGIVVWSGAYLPWIPWAGGSYVLLEPDLSYVLTILIIVATINAVNFIDGLDGLAAGVVGISAVGYLVYSYELSNSVGIQSQSVPAVASAVLAGMCLGFLPHNFNPARIFMGDTGSMLLGLLLAYGPISSTASLDQNLLIHYNGAHPVNRFPTILPLLIPVAIWLIPYTDMLLAVVRRTMKGMSPFDADRQHLHHRLQNMGHSHRQTVLLMYLWASLFAGLVVGLAVLRISLVWFAVITLAAIGALVLATAPMLRPWHSTGGGKRERPRGSRLRSDDPLSATPDLAAPVGEPVPGVLPPAALSNGRNPAHGAPARSAPPYGAPAHSAPSNNGTSPNGASSNGTGANNGAHVKRPVPNRRTGGQEPAPPAAPPPWSRRR